MLLLDQLTRRLDEKKQRLRQTMDAKDAITAAMKEMLDEALVIDDAPPNT